jgi:thioredoxin reductase
VNSYSQKRDVDVLVIGGGPTGLSAALELARIGVGRVVVVDREPRFGGIPNHCDHLGMGILDSKRILTGPGYARYKTASLRRYESIELLSEATVLSVDASRIAQVSSPDGLFEISANAILLATGCRERPRASRLVAGCRPQGIFTTGSLQQLVFKNKHAVGKRAVVVGAEHVAYSAAHTLLSSGTRVEAMVTDFPAHQTFAPVKWYFNLVRRIPLMTESQVVAIAGERRVEGVEVRNLTSGETAFRPCDTVVFTGDFIPDHEQARACGLAMDGGTKGPAVDFNFHASEAGFFAAGNIVHPSETADQCAFDGNHVALAIADYLSGKERLGAQRISIAPSDPVLWVSPNMAGWTSSAARRYRSILRVSRFLPRGFIVVRQGQRLLFKKRFSALAPNRSIKIDAGWLESVDPDGADVTIGWEQKRV